MAGNNQNEQDCLLSLEKKWVGGQPAFIRSRVMAIPRPLSDEAIGNLSGRVGIRSTQPSALFRRPVLLRRWIDYRRRRGTSYASLIVAAPPCHHNPRVRECHADHRRGRILYNYTGFEAKMLGK